MAFWPLLPTLLHFNTLANYSAASSILDDHCTITILISKTFLSSPSSNPHFPPSVDPSHAPQAFVLAHYSVSLS